jgi:DNA-binding MurR/RpiR family transcriptional regulator
MKRGNVLTQSWRSKSAVFRMYHALTLNGYSNFINAVNRQRNLGLVQAIS